MIKKQYFLVSLLMLVCNLELHASRSMYVDNFEIIIGDNNAENALLIYAQSNGIKTLLLYGLHIVNNNHNLTNTSTNSILADFIYKAKTNYDILYVGATAENEDFFTNVIDTYNNSRNDALEKFDIYNLEFEYWSDSATGAGGYYCTSYLTPNGLPCTVDGAFQYYISILQTMNTLASNNIHAIITEAYVGWTTEEQAHIIGANVDRLRLHAYVSDPNNAFNYSDNRLIDFANGTPGLDVSIIYSSETDFMQNWLENNSMLLAENIFTNDWVTASSGWRNNINLEGFTYFAYTKMEGTTLSIANNSFKTLNIYPNPIENTLYVKNINNLKKIKIYNNLGQLIIKTKKKKIELSELKRGVYFLQIHTENFIKTEKIIKE